MNVQQLLIYLGLQFESEEKVVHVPIDKVIEIMHQIETVLSNKNIKLRSFKGSENIQMKEGGPDSTVSNNQFS